MASKYFPSIYFVLSQLIVPTAYPLKDTPFMDVLFAEESSPFW